MRVVLISLAALAAAASPAAAETLAESMASAVDGTPQAAPGVPGGRVGSYAESFQALKTLRAQHPAKAKELMLVRLPKPQPTTEVNGHG